MFTGLRCWRHVGSVLLMLCVAGCTTEPDWRSDLIELSQSEYATALYYDEVLDESTVDAAMQAQCAGISRELVRGGPDSRLLMFTVFDSMVAQAIAGVPGEVQERDFGALDQGMAELCPTVHADLVEYFGFDDFARLPSCKLFSQADAELDESAPMTETCPPRDS